MHEGLWIICRSLTKNLISLNSYCTLYEESLKEELDTDIVDDLIVESKQLFLKYKELENTVFDLFL